MNHPVKTDEDLVALLERTMQHVAATAPNTELEPPVASRRWIGSVAAAAVLVVGLAAAGLALSSRHDAESPLSPAADASAPVAAGPTGLGGLLLPPSVTTTGTEAMKVAVPAGRVAASVVSPDGDLFVLNVMENFWGALPADWEQRPVGANVVGAGDEDGNIAYATVNQCSLVAINDRSATVTDWSNNATSVLDQLTLDGSAVSIALPSGWTSLGSSPINDYYSLSFSSPTSAGPAEGVLYQMPGSTASALLAQVATTSPTQTTFNGQPAWFVTAQGGTDRYLAWATAGGAAIVTIKGASDAELQQFAATLTTGHADVWARLLGGSGSSTTTPSTIVASPAADCGVHTLTVATSAT